MQISLNKAHKLLERANTKIKEIQNSLINSSLANVKYTGTVQEQQIKRLYVQSGDTDKDLVVSENLSEAVLRIRSAIGKENTALGIDVLLAERDIINRRLQFMSSLISLVKNVPVISDLSDVKDESTVIQERYTQVSLLSEESLASLIAEQSALELRLMKIADEISDLNLNKINVNFSDLDLENILGL